MKYFLFFMVFFGLPHVLWLPRKFNIAEEEIFFGFGNLILLVAIVLWVANFHKEPRLRNPFKYTTLFILLVIFGVGVALVTSFEKEYMVTLINSKREIALLLLYFLPLAIVKNRKDFVVILVVCMFVHFLVGLEVSKTGILGGSAFHDGKRGAGPFGVGWGWKGADVAAGYLAQVLMIFLAYLFGEKVKTWVRVLVGAGGLVVFVGLLATYARGAILAALVGCVAIFVAKGLKIRYLVMASLVVIVTITFLPSSIVTRFSGTTDDSGGLDSSTAGRLAYASTAFEIIKDYPVLGVGTAQIRAAMEDYQGKYVDPHNGFLYTSCEYGVLGLTVFLGMLLSFVRGARAMLKDKMLDPIYRNYAVGSIGMVATLIVCNMAYANFYKELVLGTLMIHLGMLACIRCSVST